MEGLTTFVVIVTAIIIWFIIMMFRSSETRTVDYESENARLRRELYDQEQTIQKCYDKFAEKQ